MTHFLHVCECGQVMGQCRCPGPKVKMTVRPCAHAKAQSSTPVQPLERGQVATDFRCTVCGAVFPCASYVRHVAAEHDSRTVAVHPVWTDA